jgi:hypothetical protein
VRMSPLFSWIRGFPSTPDCAESREARERVI